jgi:polyhydroxyalkanoate synthase subunit PhaC
MTTTDQTAARLDRGKATVARATVKRPRSRTNPAASEPGPGPAAPAPAAADVPPAPTAADVPPAPGGADVLFGSSPFASVGFREAIGGLRTLGRHALRDPQSVLKNLPETVLDLISIGAGRADLSPDKSDKRFTNPAWSENRFYRTLLQTYLYLGGRVDGFVDGLDLQHENAERVRFALMLLREALAPTNGLLTNPEAVRRAIDTRGESLRAGFANFVDDLVHNHGMPSQVDREPLQVGKDLAVTPGVVIFRNEVFELIQYAPPAAEVRARPLLIVPPQVNKYYALDLAPGRSMSEYLLRDGFQLFEISWRNPTAAQRDWGFDTYAQAVLDAIDVVREVSGSADVNLMGGCLGGMMAALVTALLEARGDARVHSATMTVTLLDMDTDAKIMLFASPRTLALAKQVSDRAGVIEGWEMAQMFAWLRPNDLVWNYWVNNYLLGRKPPAFDILAWNADTTRLTARFHQQLLDLVAENQLAKPGALEVLGTPIDLSRITADTYVAAGLKDHITPWQGGYQTTQMVGGRSQFVLCSSGHIQTVVAAPDHPRLGYFVNPDTPAEPEKWLADAQRREGSWWAHWSDWLAGRSGELVAAPASLGSTQYPPMEPAPGTYIFQ